MLTQRVRAKLSFALKNFELFTLSEPQMLLRSSSKILKIVARLAANEILIHVWKTEIATLRK